MKVFISLIVLMISLSSFASSGASSISLVLEQSEVEKLDEKMRETGFILSKIEDKYAQRGSFPRCACRSLDMTFTKVTSGKAVDKKFNISASGFGTSLKVTINPVKN